MVYWQFLLPVDRVAYRRDMDHQSEVRDFLTTRRARLNPDQAGLPHFAGRRRAPGLRREEVAMLTGVSTEYYARLERGHLAGRFQPGPGRAGPCAPPRRVRTRPPARPRPSRRPGPSATGHPAAHPTTWATTTARCDGLDPRLRPDRPPRHRRRQPTRTGTLQRHLHHFRQPAEPDPLHLPRPSRPRLLPRVGHRRPRHRRRHAQRSRPQPPRPHPEQPGRRTVRPAAASSAPGGPATKSAPTTHPASSSTTPSRATWTSTAKDSCYPTTPGSRSSPTPTSQQAPQPKASSSSLAGRTTTWRQRRPDKSTGATLSGPSPLPPDAHRTVRG